MTYQAVTQSILITHVIIKAKMLTDHQFCLQKKKAKIQLQLKVKRMEMNPLLREVLLMYKKPKTGRIAGLVLKINMNQCLIKKLM